MLGVFETFKNIDFIHEPQCYYRTFVSDLKEKTKLLPHVAVKIPTCGKKFFLTCPLHLPVWVRNFISVIVDVNVERVIFTYYVTVGFEIRPNG